MFKRALNRSIYVFLFMILYLSSNAKASDTYIWVNASINKDSGTCVAQYANSYYSPSGNPCLHYATIWVTGATQYNRNVASLLHSLRSQNNPYPNYDNTTARTETVTGTHSYSCFDVLDPNKTQCSYNSNTGKWVNLDPDKIYQISYEVSPAFCSSYSNMYYAIYLPCQPSSVKLYGIKDYLEGTFHPAYSIDGTPYPASFVDDMVYICTEHPDNCEFYGITPPISPPSHEVILSGTNPIDHTLTISGYIDAGRTGIDYELSAYFFMQCETPSKDFIDIQDHAFAKLTCRTTNSNTATIMVDDFSYTGYGYTSDTTKCYFNNITAPYTAGLNCTYPYYLTLTDKESNTLLYSTNNPSYGYPVGEIVPDGATSLISSSSVPDEYSGLFGGIKRFFRDLLYNAFSFRPLKDNIGWMSEHIQSRLRVKAPFGYIYYAFQQEISPAPLPDPNTPEMSIDLRGIYNLPKTDIYLSDAAKDVFSSIRNIFNIVFAMLFFYYIVALARRIF